MRLILECEKCQQQAQQQADDGEPARAAHKSALKLDLPGEHAKQPAACGRIDYDAEERGDEHGTFQRDVHHADFAAEHPTDSRQKDRRNELEDQCKERKIQDLLYEEFKHLYAPPVSA